MNTLNNIDNDDAQILLFESIVCPEYENVNHFANAFDTSSPDDGHQNGNAFAECNVENCNKLLNLNKKITSSLLDLKRRITFALEKCERKLTAIDRGLQTHTAGDTKVLICNASMPYFKDRNYFFASSNEDDILKETRKELQVRNLLKVSPWSRKDRNTLFKSIQQQVFADELCSNKLERTRIDNGTLNLNSNVKDREEIEKELPFKDFVQMVGHLHEREFDWFKISSTHFEDAHSPLDCRVMWHVFLHPSINKKCWTKSEDAKLKEIGQKYKFQNWDEIAKELNTKRTAYQCFIRYNTTKKLPKIKNCNWKSEEDERLLKLIEIFRVGDFIPWGEIASWMWNRTKQQVYFRWTYSLAPYLIKGRFTKVEDNILRDAVIKYGTNFRKISAALMPNRSTVQLHDRYQTLLTNQIENWNLWTLAEDTKLLDLYNCLGSNWSAIAKKFSSKTRTQLRHRFAALQKYIKRGVSLNEIHRTHLPNGEGENQQTQMAGAPSWDAFKSCNNANDTDYYSDIDRELIEYFHTERKTKIFVQGQKRSNLVENLNDNVTSLYNILEGLNAKLSIPDDISDLNVENADMQLLYLLRKYMSKKNDKEHYLKFINEYRLRMFNRNTAMEESSHFVPPPPFQSQKEVKKSKKSLCIDYTLNTNNTFLLEQAIDFDTPDLVISNIGGNEEELQFQKLSNLFQSDCHIISRIQTIKQGNNLFRNQDVDASSVLSTETPQEPDIHAIDPNHATLLCLKNLLYLKRLNERFNNRPHQCLLRSVKFRDAFNLLSIRLQQLFKYPIGLSNTTLPEVYAIDTFSYDDGTSKRKISDASEIIEERKTKKKRSIKKSYKNVR